MRFSSDWARAALRQRSDADGVGDARDSCQAVANADQADADADGVGDVCEAEPLANGGCTCEAASGTSHGALALSLSALSVFISRRQRARIDG
jgi:hypothetical protein